MNESRLRSLMLGWFILAAASIGMLIGMLFGFFALPHEKEIICPPIIDAASRIDLIYPSGGGPEPTELDWEFAEACGFETIKGPVKIQPAAPEEGGA